MIARFGQSLLVVALALSGAGAPGAAQEVDTARIEAGLQLFKSVRTECSSCHGWAGLGKAADHPYSTVEDLLLEYGGPSLQASTLDRAAMIEVISCGRIAGIKIMPQYRGDAWTAAAPCWGKTAADIPAAERPLRAFNTLAPREIEIVVDYIQAVYQGKEMTWDWCRKYFDDFERICEVWREHGIQ